MCGCCVCMYVCVYLQVRLDDEVYTLIPPRSAADGTSDGPTPHSTGLGLPLSRALTKAGGGWLGLEDDVVAVESRGGDGVAVATTPTAASPTATDVTMLAGGTSTTRSTTRDAGTSHSWNSAAVGSGGAGATARDAGGDFSSLCPAVESVLTTRYWAVFEAPTAVASRDTIVDMRGAAFLSMRVLDGIPSGGTGTAPAPLPNSAVVHPAVALPSARQPPDSPHTVEHERWHTEVRARAFQYRSQSLQVDGGGGGGPPAATTLQRSVSEVRRGSTGTLAVVAEGGPVFKVGAPPPLTKGGDGGAAAVSRRNSLSDVHCTVGAGGVAAPAATPPSMVDEAASGGVVSLLESVGADSVGGDVSPLGPTARGVPTAAAAAAAATVAQALSPPRVSHGDLLPGMVASTSPPRTGTRARDVVVQWSGLGVRE